MTLPWPAEKDRPSARFRSAQTPGLALEPGVRDVFPLPLMADPSTRCVLGGRARRRQMVRVAHAKRINGAICSLSWMAGYEYADYSALPPADGMQLSIVQRIEGLVSCMEPTFGCTEREAFRTLCGGAADYQGGGGTANLAPF